MEAQNSLHRYLPACTLRSCSQSPLTASSCDRWRQSWFHLGSSRYRLRTGSGRDPAERPKEARLHDVHVRNLRPISCTSCPGYASAAPALHTVLATAATRGRRIVEQTQTATWRAKPHSILVAAPSDRFSLPAFRCPSPTSSIHARTHGRSRVPTPLCPQSQSAAPLLLLLLLSSFLLSLPSHPTLTHRGWKLIARGAGLVPAEHQRLTYWRPKPRVPGLVP